MLLASGLALAPRARAQDRAEDRCAIPSGAAPSLGALDGRARLEWISARLDRTGHSATVWTWGWGIGITAATAGNLAFVPFVAPDQRIDWYTGAVSTIVGIVPIVLWPPPVIADAKAVRLRLAAPGAATTVCQDLAFAEGRLAAAANDQALARSWWVHAGNVVFNAGVGLFLGLGYHHWVAGALNFGFGAAVGEAIILTQPDGNIDDLRRYRAGTLEPAAPPLALGYGGRF